MVRRSVITIIMGIVCIFAYPHDFITNPDYVYAVGEGKTQDEAERAAFMSLSSKLKIEVKNEVKHSLSLNDNEISENYSSVSGLYSGMTFGEEIETAVEKVKNKHYRVYKYINKREYVERQHDLSKYYFNKADSLEHHGNKFVKHAQNLILGYYYKAYEALDTDLMNAFEDNDSEKQRILNRDSVIYQTTKYGLPTLVRGSGSNYYVEMAGVVHNSEPIGLCGFEYYFRDGWKTPQNLFVHSYDSYPADSHDVFDSTLYHKCIIRGDNNKIQYRILYEYEENGNYYRINVGDRWYFNEFYITNYNNIK